MIHNRPISLLTSFSNFLKLYLLGYLNIVMITVFRQRNNLASDGTLLLKKVIYKLFNEIFKTINLWSGESTRLCQPQYIITEIEIVRQNRTNIFFFIPRQAKVALGVPGRLRSRMFSTFGTTRVEGRQPNAPAAFTPGEIPGTHFQRLSRRTNNWNRLNYCTCNQGTWFCWKEPRKKSQVTPPGIDPGTVRLAAQRLNHYATPGPDQPILYLNLIYKDRYQRVFINS
jgi:hypothetical protein